MAGRRAISLEKYYPFTEEELIEISEYTSQPYNHMKGIRKYQTYGCKCGEITLALGYHDGDGDYFLIRDYFCSKCGEELRFIIKDLGNEEILKINKKYGKKFI